MLKAHRLKAVGLDRAMETKISIINKGWPSSASAPSTVSSSRSGASPPRSAERSAAHGAPLGDWRAAESEAELAEAVAALGGNIFVKSARGGYDGRSQVKIGFGDSTTASDVWLLLGAKPCVAEKALDLDREISVMVARAPNEETKSFPSALNHHENQILEWSVIPSSVPADLEARAQQISASIAAALGIEGLLAVEMFVTKHGELLVNELAPRPHNSYHASELACVTSQFEQAVRAVCDLPLGDVSVVQPAAIANLLGDLWASPGGEPREPRFDRALAVPGVSLHLYEKQKPRKGRKMGHLSAVGKTPDEAVQRVMTAKELL
jgi:5-(carboxyamino)imidazole ribonucleotide synthase